MSLFNDFAFSEQGYNHIKVGKECQDASGSYSDDYMSICVVADGHGSDNYPRTALGSGFAVEVTIDAIKTFVSTLNDANEEFDLHDAKNIQLKGLAKNILMRWHDLVDEDVKHNPFTEKELEKVSDKYKAKYASGDAYPKAYGTTLLAACVTPNYWFGLHIGDGKCIAIDTHGNCTEPIPWDENCQANITTSICDSDAFDEFRFYKSSDLPLAVFLGCDGIDDSYAGDEELHNFYRSILFIFGENGLNVGKSEVKEFLPKLSRQGSGDDVSISGLIKSDISLLTINLIKAQVEYDNAFHSMEILENECKVAEERVSYISEALKKTRKSLTDIEEKQVQAQANYEKKAAERAVAHKKLQEAEEMLAKAQDEFNNPVIILPEVIVSEEHTAVTSPDVITAETASSAQNTDSEDTEAISKETITTEETIVAEEVLPVSPEALNETISVADEPIIDNSEEIVAVPVNIFADNISGNIDALQEIKDEEIK